MYFSKNKTTSLLVICSLLFFANFWFACNVTEKNAHTTDKQILNPNGDSELALLMRAMFDDAARMKAQLDKGEQVTPNIDHKKILTAHATEPHKAASAQYKAFSAAYLNIIDSFEQAQKDDIDALYTDMVNSCIACHQSLCPGPIVRIEQLY